MRIGNFQMPLAMILLMGGLSAITLSQPPDFGDRIRQLDANNDGEISPDEIPDRMKPFFESRARSAGLDTSKPQPVEQWITAISKSRNDDDDDHKDDRDDGRRRGREDDRGRDRDDDRRRRDDDRRDRDDAANESADLAQVPGFGVDIELAAVPGFGLAEGEGQGSVKSAGVPIEDRYNSRVINYVDGILRRYDRNGDDRLDESEWRRGRWRSSPEASDLNKDGVLSRDELCQRVAGYSEFASSERESRSSGDGEKDRNKYREYSKGLLRRYDENKNGILEKDEWSRMSSFHRGADYNKDGRITSDELANRLASYGKESSRRENNDSGSRGSSSDREGSGAGESYLTKGPRRDTYRAKTATERLPKGLPDWFVRNDANGDGQIQMSEFAVTWNAEKIEEFNGFDLNRDGIVTASEVSGDARSSKSSSSSSEDSRRSSAPSSRSRSPWSRSGRR